MSQRFDHGSLILAVRACYNDDATDLLAVAGEHSVDVLQLSQAAHTRIASFHIGSRVTALAWSPRTVSPSSSDQWFLELAAASADNRLHLLTKSSSNTDETIVDFGGGLSGHHEKITGVEFSGGQGEEGARYIATVSMDKTLMVWDLNPDGEMETTPISPSHSPALQGRSPPTAYVIPFPYPLVDVKSHPTSSKEFLIADSHGSIFLIDWRTDPMENGEQNWRHHSLAELVEPRVMADTMSGIMVYGPGSIAWRRDAVDIIGAVYGSIFSVWDIAKVQGGKPQGSGVLPEGGQHFRWCPTYPDIFAISSQSRAKGASIQVFNTKYIHTQPLLVTLASAPHIVRDFDFMADQGTTRVVAAVGKELFIFEINIES